MKTKLKLLKNTQKYRRTKKGVLTNMYHHMKSRHKVDFTLKQFHEMYLEDITFNNLMYQWKKLGHLPYYKPSLDRVNPKKHYSKDNIKMITWGQNRLKQSTHDHKLGLKPPVLQIKNGKVVHRHQSQKHAVETLGCSQGTLSMVLNGKKKSLYGYTFVYESPELLEEES